MSFREESDPERGLLPAAVLARRIGLGELVEQRLGLGPHGASSGAKALTVIGSMLAGGDTSHGKIWELGLAVRSSS